MIEGTDKPSMFMQYSYFMSIFVVGGSFLGIIIINCFLNSSESKNIDLSFTIYFHIINTLMIIGLIMYMLMEINYEVAFDLSDLFNFKNYTCNN